MSAAGTFTEILVSAMIVVGATFALIGSWGLVRLPTLMERLHGPTKATTLGLGGMLVASVLFFQLHRGSWSTHELLITLFLFISAPISANLIAKVHLHRLRVDAAGEIKSPAGCPPTPGAGDWATYRAPQPGSPIDTSDG
jgi:multicomponent K+:H+ antiporter subunit G